VRMAKGIAHYDVTNAKLVYRDGDIWRLADGADVPGRRYALLIDGPATVELKVETDAQRWAKRALEEAGLAPPRKDTAGDG